LGALYLPGRYRGLSGDRWPRFSLRSFDEDYASLEADREKQRDDPAVEEARARLPLLSEEEARESLRTGPAWPRFRGANDDGKYAGGGLLERWPEKGPPLLYRRPIGAGWSGFAVGHGRAYTIEQRRDREVIACYDFETGLELWTHEYEARFSDSAGGPGPRATPTLDGDRVYALGAAGRLSCLNAFTGESLWDVNVRRLFGEPLPAYGAAASPLISRNNVVVTSTGTNGLSVITYEKMTGATGWATVRQPQGYTSVIEASLLGRRQFINVSGIAVNGLDPDSGEVLWSHPWEPNLQLNNAQPIVVGDDRLFLSSEYGLGCALLQLRRDGDAFAVEELWKNLNMMNKFASSVEIAGFVYGLHQEQGFLVCLDLETGRTRWRVREEYGCGQILHADGKLVVQSEMGELALVRATPEGFEELGRFEAIEGKSWNPMAMADGRLLIRNGREMACYDLRATP
jgi:outer membrane protein assembly factor BamB